ncbi:tRNA (guanosine(46)-N7)-methyltransferase TrmB [Candidatus Poribacteria bacterium]|jgi:tRNA (guanine-N7-)-methyltransferase|nr:tRNA (guanosine(46)-N7)-methyltransferase TrmB [Candidatus Poribacteria bacterium]MDP6597858.1 tRNA (guanosine(46)-N7)-methyltransferase TrmB [Candidatus Poribacteria bacterium]MDP6746222.1 tRNA (guanosine(46)-N7)-methyltransferase TrmB [Candidatus Poribacteria bacterium]MDP6996730.1 tRNA (guanosine(46)-N7)-methyltransferase TrmB [Candidatus Poribacteria bacterium]MDP7279114.1 tRNA (guanosine(46)-N7)-methyltransferase TrmB [Candidatus Poribacteria bacterium]
MSYSGSNDRYWTHLANIRLLRLSDNEEIDLRRFEPPLDWIGLFGNNNPVQIEVGCGKGRFLVESAQQNANVNYIGIENSWKYVLRTQQRLKKHGLTNACLVYADAAYFAQNYVPDHSIQAYHIYFPDPWPKDRHQKRRLFNNPIWIDQAVRTLDSREGHLFVATDFTDYFVQIKHRLDDTSQLIYLPELSQDTNYIQTSFEIKYRTQGRQIYRAVYRIKNEI